jgi:hypothetical protein
MVNHWDSRWETTCDQLAGGAGELSAESPLCWLDIESETVQMSDASKSTAKVSKDLLEETRPLESTDQREKALENLVRTLEDGDDKAASEKLLQLQRQDKTLALAVADYLSDPRAAKKFLELSGQPGNKTAVEFMSAVLKAGCQPDSRESSVNMYFVQRILSMLGDPGQQHKDAAVLLEMVNKRDSQADAAAMLNAFGSDPELLHSVLELRKDSSRQPEFQAVRSLIASEDGQERRSGTQLFALMASSEGIAKAVARDLLQMVASSQRADACALLDSSLEPQYIAEMLKIKRNPALPNLYDQLVTAADSPRGRSNVRELLDLKKSPDLQDKADAKELMDLLNDNDPAVRATAGKMLDTADREHTHQLLLRWRNGDEGKRQVEKILDLLSSPARSSEVKSGRALLAMLASSDGSENKTAEKVLSLICGDEQSQAKGWMIFACGQDQSERKAVIQLITIMDSIVPKDGEDADKLLKMIAASGQDRVVAVNLLTLKGESVSVYEMMLKLLGTNKELASGLLKALPDSEDLKAFMKIAEDPKQKVAAKELEKMLLAGDRSNVEQFVEVIKSSQDTALTAEGRFRNIRSYQERRVAEQIVGLLNQPETQTLAKQVMKSFDNINDAERLLEMYKNYPQRADGKLRVPELVDHLYKQYPDLAKPLLTKMVEPHLIERFLKLSVELNSENTDDRAARKVLLKMVETGAATQLMRLLDAPEGSQRRNEGEELLATLRARPYGSFVPAILESKLSPAAYATLQQALTKADPASQEARQGKALVTMLSSHSQSDRVCATNLLEMMGYDSNKPAAGLLLGMLFGSSAADKEAAYTLLSTARSDYQAAKTARLLASSNPAEVAGTRELLKLLATPRDDQNDLRAISGLASDILEEAAGADGQPRAGSDAAVARELIKMLGNDKTRLAAGAILTSVDDKYNALLMAKELVLKPDETDKGKVTRAGQLARLLSSTDPADATAKKTMISLLTHRRNSIQKENLKEMGEKLLDMLKTPEHDTAEKILRGCRSVPALVGLMLLREQGKYPEATRQLMDILSSDPERREGANMLLESFSLNRHGSFSAEEDILRRNFRVEDLLSLLNKPETLDVGRGILAITRTGQEQNGLTGLATDPDGQKHFEQLLKMLAEDKAGTKQLIAAELTGDQLRGVLDLAANSQKASESRELMSLVTSSDIKRQFAGGAVASALRSSDERERSSALTLLAMLSSESTERRSTAEIILFNFNASRHASRLLAITENKDLGAAGDNLLELFSSEDFRSVSAANNLMTLLASTDAKERSIGNRLLQMLKDDRNKAAAVRILNTRR